MKKLTTTIAAALLVATLVSASGCNAIPWLANFFAKPEVVEPVCTIPEETKILVYVSDLKLSETTDCTAICRALTTSINEQMLANEVVTEVIPYEDLLRFMAGEPTFKQMDFGDIAAGMDADMVLYVRLKSFSLKDDDTALLWQGNLSAVAKLVDADNRLLWPVASPDGQPIDPVSISGERQEFQTYGVKLTEQLAAQMADQIVKFFYQHEVPPGTAARRERQEADEYGDD